MCSLKGNRSNTWIFLFTWTTLFLSTSADLEVFLMDHNDSGFIIGTHDSGGPTRGLGGWNGPQWIKRWSVCRGCLLLTRVIISVVIISESPLLLQGDRTQGESPLLLQGDRTLFGRHILLGKGQRLIVSASIPPPWCQPTLPGGGLSVTVTSQRSLSVPSPLHLKTPSRTLPPSTLSHLITTTWRPLPPYKKNPGSATVWHWVQRKWN